MRAADGRRHPVVFAKEYHLERGLRESVLSLLAMVPPELALCFFAEQAPGLPKSC
jgi:acyl-CoA dehydrogenase